LEGHLGGSRKEPKSLFESKLTLPTTKNTRELDVRQLGWAIWTTASFIFGFENYGELRHRKKNGPGL